jgi:hypothetical protein
MTDTPTLESFVAELVALKNEAGRLGLWKTMHALDEATTAVGWEWPTLLAKQTAREVT